MGCNRVVYHVVVVVQGEHFMLSLKLSRIFYEVSIWYYLDFTFVRANVSGLGKIVTGAPIWWSYVNNPNYIEDLE